MNILHISLSIGLIVGWSFLYANAYATCMFIPGTRQCTGTLGPVIALYVVKSTYVSGDSIMIHGAEGPDEIIQLSLIDPNGDVEKSVQTTSDNTGQFLSDDLRIPTNATLGIWKIMATRGISHSTLEIQVISPMSNVMMGNNTNVTMPTRGNNESISSSPLKQFRSGIVTKDVSCNWGLVLIEKVEDSSPACVTSNTATILTERGWGHLL